MSEETRFNSQDTVQDETAWQSEQKPEEDELWLGDTGQLPLDARKALRWLLTNPSLSSTRQQQNWLALLAYEEQIRSALHDLFLELVIDRNIEVAFTKQIDSPQLNIPVTLRDRRLPFLQSVMVLVLRERLLNGDLGQRVVVDKDDICLQLTAYQNGDDTAFKRNLNAAWTAMKELGFIYPIERTDGMRAEISPVLAIVFDENQIKQLNQTYQRLANTKRGYRGSEDDSLDDESASQEEDEQ